MPETVREIGEFGLIDRINALLKREGTNTPGVKLGIGDDTAAFQPSSGYEILVTCDAMVEGRHYLPERIRPLDLGRRAMAINISDIGAMGGQPLYALVSLGLKGDAPVAHVEAMYRGFLAELNPLGACIIGGNLTKSGEAGFIDVTLIGQVEEGKAVRRSTARVGDAILLTGYTGQAAAGLEIFLHAQEFEGLYDHPLVRVFNTPSHRAREGRAIAQTGCATAMIDVSDGLLGDLGHICKESGVGAVLSQTKLPVSAALKEAAEKMGRDVFEWILGDSDDYELVITCPPDHVGDIRAAVSRLTDLPVTEIGRISDASNGLELALPDGSRRPVSPIGWDHFTK